MKKHSAENKVKELIQFIGEDTDNEHMIKTPERVVRSWNELFGGYKEDPASVFTVFDPDEYDEMVLLKDIEFYSTCAHHWLPFLGKAHIAYIPSSKEKVIGVSKLARLLEIYSRRFQIQERLCSQVTRDLMKYLKPEGAACIIQAKHLCVCARGVGKQGSSMVTSSLTGCFKEPAVRQELLALIAMGV